MLPAALSTGLGSEGRSPMAYAIIGGLITSTFLTLIVVPVIYTLLDDAKGFFRKKQFTVVGRKSFLTGVWQTTVTWRKPKEQQGVG